jgi:hypothetical protein
MTIIYPINGKNERLGNLFKTPKHLLLYKGVPAIVASVNYMRSLFPDAQIVILANERYSDVMWDLLGEDAWIEITPDTESQVDTLRWLTGHMTEGSVMFVDCDIVPISINPPNGNTVYLFENKKWMKQYSNYELDACGFVTKCNEKGEYHPYAGAGIYHFIDVQRFNENSIGCKNISEVIAKYGIFYADTLSQIFRFGTLNDIKNDESLTDRIY